MGMANFAGALGKAPSPYPLPQRERDICGTALPFLSLGGEVGRRPGEGAFLPLSRPSKTHRLSA